MTEWWTYRLHHLLMFSRATYVRLYELHNEALGWPLVAAVQLLAAGVLVAALARWRRGEPLALLAAAAAWLAVGWCFHIGRYAAVNWPATAFGAAFVAQGALLGGAAWQRRRAAGWSAAAPARRAGLALMAFALLGQPLITLTQGAPAAAAELVGIAPDPTVLATLGLLLAGGVRTPWLWTLPLAWCGVSGLTLWALELPHALLLPAAALLALAALRAR